MILRQKCTQTSRMLQISFAYWSSMSESIFKKNNWPCVDLHVVHNSKFCAITLHLSVFWNAVIRLYKVHSYCFTCVWVHHFKQPPFHSRFLFKVIYVSHILLTYEWILFLITTLFCWSELRLHVGPTISPFVRLVDMNGILLNYGEVRSTFYPVAGNPLACINWLADRYTYLPACIEFLRAHRMFTHIVVLLKDVFSPV